MINRRTFLASAGGLATALLVPAAARSARQEGLTWHSITAEHVEGKGWSDTARPFDRLPARAEGVVREPVWDLSRHSAGLLVRFETDAPAIHARYALTSDRLAMPHMPATGVSGLDLYGRDAQGRWRWAAVVRPTEQEIETSVAEGLAPERRAYTLYFPLYNGVHRLDLGVPEGAAFAVLPPRTEPPVLCYGTSILHGACASRPGMAWPAILGRRLGRPVINLGFSGNGRMEPEVGALLAELDPSLYIVDCLPNLNAEQVAERTEPLVRQLRAAHPETPIVLVEDRTYADAAFRPARQARNETSRKAFRQAYARLLLDGVPNLSYVVGTGLLGTDGEATTDGSHPNDLGMTRYADALEPVVRRALGEA